MQKLFNRFRGTITVEVQGPFLERWFNICAAAGLGLWNVQLLEEGKRARVSLSRWRLEEAKGLAEKAMCTLHPVGESGLPAFLRQFRFRYGMIAGAVLSLLVLLIGKESIQGAVLKADIPESIRKMVPKGYFRSRLKKVSSEVKSSFYETLETEQNEAIIEQMVSDISVQIEQCLHKMAEVVEIPLG